MEEKKEKGEETERVTDRSIEENKIAIFSRVPTSRASKAEENLAIRFTLERNGRGGNGKDRRRTEGGKNRYRSGWRLGERLDGERLDGQRVGVANRTSQ